MLIWYSAGVQYTNMIAVSVRLLNNDITGQFLHSTGQQSCPDHQQSSHPTGPHTHIYNDSDGTE